MKAWLLMLLLLGLLLSATMAAKKKSREGKARRSFQELERVEDDDDDDDDSENESDDDAGDDEQSEKNAERRNPCLDKRCRRGELCTVDRRFKARCVCYTKCQAGLPGDTRFQVCSKRNVTYESECALDRDHCLCRRQKDGCSNPSASKIRLDYFGPCQQMGPCSERAFNEFPHRTREWMYVVMKELATRAEIPEYETLVEQADRDTNHAQAVLWKFCDLDVAPHDRAVSRRELLYTIQSLKILEPCLLPFLDTCDSDSDGEITLTEWGVCLGLEADKIKDVCTRVGRKDRTKSKRK